MGPATSASSLRLCCAPNKPGANCTSRICVFSSSGDDAAAAADGFCPDRRDGRMEEVGREGGDGEKEGETTLNPTNRLFKVAPNKLSDWTNSIRSLMIRPKEFTRLSVCLSVCLSLCLPASLYVCLSVCLPLCMSVFLSACLSVCLPLCLSVTLSHLGVLWKCLDFHPFSM